MPQATLTIAKATIYPDLLATDADKIKNRDAIGNNGLVHSNATSSEADSAFADQHKHNGCYQ